MDISHSVTRYRFLLVICVVAIIATFLLPPIAQDPLYHQFADQNSLKHITAGIGCLVFLRHLRLRSRLDQ
jgi:hypothetical protein